MQHRQTPPPIRPGGAPRLQSIRLPILAITVALLAPSRPSQAEDIIHLKHGAPLHGDILQIADDQVKIHVRQGNAMAVRALPDDAIDFIDFEVPEAEAKALASGDGRALRVVWIGKQKLLGRRESNAGQIALAYAEALLEVDSDPAKSDALELFTNVEKDDWNAKRRVLARTGRLRALLALGNAEAAMAEARAMAEETEDPALFLEARHVLATIDFQELEKQVDENPRWEEDDTVRESIRALYDGTVDRALEPYLFYGSEEAAAARGLLLAARTHRLAGREEDARSCAEDILALYAKTEYAARAKEFLSESPDHKRTGARADKPGTTGKNPPKTSKEDAQDQTDRTNSAN